MNKRGSKTGLSLFFALTLSASGFASEDHLQARHLVLSGAIQPLETLLESVRKHHQGRVLEVELEYEQDRYIYQIELLDETGVVWEIQVDAATGTLLTTERED